MEKYNTISIVDETSQNFIDFSYEANSQRAFADARDGLKPGQRACLWEMYDKGYVSSKPHVKSAKISGGVIANWWPHGDVAIYETFARMSQPWINNVPEVDWHGANGSIIISGEPASSRYTEARLSKVSEEGLLYGIKKHNVPMIPNFSDDAEMPAVLPAIMPRLMVNGCQGIGVTIANVWLPHALHDVTEVIKNYVNTGVLDYSNLAPSFPTGGIIINKNDIPQIYATGKGKVILRAKVEIEKNSIFITELPYQVYVEPLVDEIKTLIKKDEIVGISDIYNKSSGKKLLIEIVCDQNPVAILNKLFKVTDLQKTYSANQWALVGKTPELLNLKQYLDIYIQHNRDCIKREYEFELSKAKPRLEVINGLLKALEDIDNIITLIRSSESAAAAKDNLKAKYDFTENQAKAIVDMKLGRLAHLEGVELNKEKENLIKNIGEYENIIANEDRRTAIFIERLSSFDRAYGDSRKTELTQIDIKPEEKEIVEVVPEDVVVIVTKTGNVKRIPKTSFRTQKRNGVGVKTTNDVILSSISTNTVDILMVFTNKGKMYRILVDNLPVGTNVSNGQPLSTLLKMEPDEAVTAVTSLHRKTDAEYVVFFTKNGLIKKTKLEEFTSGKKTTGIQAIKIKEGDSLIDVTFLKDEPVIVVTKNGYGIHFETKDIAPIGRVTSGVRSIKLADGDEVVAGLPVKDKKYLTIITATGLGKRVAVSEFPIQTRGGKGVIASKTPIIGAAAVNDDSLLLLTGTPSSICISASDIPILSRTGAGNLMIKNSKITNIVKI